jgi:hypothetical protein
MASNWALSTALMPAMDSVPDVTVVVKVKGTAMFMPAIAQRSIPHVTVMPLAQMLKIRWPAPPQKVSAIISCT